MIERLLSLFERFVLACEKNAAATAGLLAHVQVLPAPTAASVPLPAETTTAPPAGSPVAPALTREQLLAECKKRGIEVAKGIRDTTLEKLIRSWDAAHPNGCPECESCPEVPAPDDPEPAAGDVVPEETAAADPLAEEPDAFAEPEATAPTVTIDEVRGVLQQVAAKRGREVAKTLVQKAGAELLRDVKPENLRNLLGAAKAALA